MENQIEQTVENRIFETRQKIQSKLICDSLGLNAPDEASNEQASEWIKTYSKVFSDIISNIVHEYPSFWNDAEQNFGKAVELVKQKMIEKKSHSDVQQ